MITSTTILFAEDDDNYAALFKHVFQQGGFNHLLHHVKDGAEAMMYLKGEEKYSDRSKYPLPYVILADLKMPRVNGFELLDWVSLS
jgi:CheY-like chemotaxis protein